MAHAYLAEDQLAVHALAHLRDVRLEHGKPNRHREERHEGEAHGAVGHHAVGLDAPFIVHLGLGPTAAGSAIGLIGPCALHSVL